uniref:Uncharacterized protein n=1 Tax=Oryza meridionalis TaxID=40149 RepID=A0A0E0FC15_9ORYZ
MDGVLYRLELGGLAEDEIGEEGRAAGEPPAGEHSRRPRWGSRSRGFLRISGEWAVWAHTWQSKCWGYRDGPSPLESGSTWPVINSWVAPTVGSRSGLLRLY